MILVLNTGSSSIKFALFDPNDKLRRVLDGEVGNIGSESVKTHKVAFDKLAAELANESSKVETIAYRVVNAGGLVPDGTEVSEDVLLKIDKFSPVCLHNPYALTVIKEAMIRFPNCSHKVFFDTTFFKELPEASTTLPLSSKIAILNKIRKYGFHGISHQYAYFESNFPKTIKRILSLHLGAGCSITAIFDGKPLDTSMGFTPDAGLIMQTRSGDIDPGIIFYLSDIYGIERTKEIIEKESGLAGLSGTNGNMLDILFLNDLKIEDKNYQPSPEIKKTANKPTKLAFQMYINAIVKYIGAYAAMMGGVDGIIFTGKIGAGSSVIRKLIMDKIEFLNIKDIAVVKPDEELAIARLVTGK